MRTALFLFLISVVISGCSSYLIKPGDDISQDKGYICASFPDFPCEMLLKNLSTEKRYKIDFPHYPQYYLGELPPGKYVIISMSGFDIRPFSGTVQYNFAVPLVLCRLINIESGTIVFIGSFETVKDEQNQYWINPKLDRDILLKIKDDYSLPGNMKINVLLRK
ncbi:MAG: hypothetical protein P8107_01715 [Spirochaetia bacterium]